MKRIVLISSFLFVAGCSLLTWKDIGEYLLVASKDQEFLLTFVNKIDQKVRSENGDELPHLKNVSEEDLKKIEALFKAAVALLPERDIPIVPAPPVLDEKALGEINDIIAEADKHWFDRNGFIRLGSNANIPDNGVDNENPILFTAEYFYVLHRLGVLKGDLKTRYLAYIKEKMGSLMLQPGLYDRRPTIYRADEKQVRSYSHDEQAGTITMDTVFDMSLGTIKESYDYGKSHMYVYNNRGWSGVNQYERPVYKDDKIVPKIEVELEALRLPSFIELIRRANKATPSLVSDALICGGILTGAKKPCNDTSSKMMSFLKAIVLQGSSKELDACFKEFIYLVQKQYTQGMTCQGKTFYCKDLFCNVADFYYQDPMHPIRRLSRYL